jgi:hypothetical protein
MDSTSASDAPRGEAAWQAAKRRIADRNAEASRAGKKERDAHDTRIARARRAASDPDVPHARA